MISVIVPAYNAADTIAECLDALLNQTVPRSEYEVIVVDDGSSDNTREIVESYDVKILSQPNGGPGAARNLGVDNAQGSIVLFTDADCAPAPDWISEMIRPLGDPNVVAVKGAYRSRQRTLVARFIQLEFEERYELLEREPYVDFVDSCAAAYRKDLFLAAGGFDARFRMSEDVDLAYRLSTGGYKMVFNPRAVVDHRHRESLWAYFRVKSQRAYWRTQSYRRHPDKILRDSYTPQSLKMQMGLVLLLGFMILSGLLVTNHRKALFLGASSVALLFLVSVLPFAARAIRRDRLVGLLSPFFLFLRAAALGFGFGLGLVRQLRDVLSEVVKPEE